MHVGAEARDTQIEYYKTLRKPMKVNPHENVIRMLTLARFGNKLPGTEHPLTDLQINQCIFHSFPTQWQQQFICSNIQTHCFGQYVATTALSNIIAFMSNEKSFADAQDTTCTFQKDTRNIGGKGSSCGGPARGGGCGNGQYNFVAAATVPKTPQHHQNKNFQGNLEQHHSDQIGQDPNWAWDTHDPKTTGE
jgi:hypothetical protein